MKRLTILVLSAAAAALVPCPPSASADEPPEVQLEFVRKLRAKGYSDLAMQYLDELSKNPQPALAPLLPLEIARTRVSLGRDKDAGQRLALYAQARAELEKTVQKEPGGPNAAQMRLELARIAGLQGQALRTQALSQEDPKAEEELARKAENQFAQAGKELEAAAKGLEAQLAAFKAPDPAQEKFLRQQLTDDLFNARFERAKNYIDQAHTIFDIEKDDKLRDRKATLLDQAKKSLEAVAKDVGSPQTSYLAFAWLIKINLEIQDPTKAELYYQRVVSTKDPAAAAAKRWARLFWVQGLEENKQVKMTPAQRVKFIHDEAKAWLAAYAPYRNAPEGQAMQYELAKTYITQAYAVSKDLKTGPSRLAAREAQKILTNLASLDGDYSKRAAALNLRLAFQQMGESTPVEKLKDFDECYLKAQYELDKLGQVEAKLAKAKPDEAKQLQAERKKHMDTAIAAFERGLKLADAKTPAGSLNEARFFLTVANQHAGRPEEAAAQGEQLARLKVPSKRSAPAAGYALQAYAALVAADPSDANREKLRSFADFILREKAQAWAAEPVVPLARYQLGVLAIREHKHEKAVEELEKLPKDFGHYTFAQCQAALTALNAAREAKLDADKARWQDRALAILRRVSRLPERADPATAQMFFAAQLKHGELLYNAGAAHLGKSEFKQASAKLGEMQKFLADLRGQFAKASEGLDDRPKEELQNGLEMLGKYALLGAADAEYRQGNYDKVVSKDLLGGVVAQVQELGKNSKQIQLRDFQITGSILGLALRAHVQKGDPKSAEAVLDLLQRLDSPDGQAADPTAVLRSLVGELQVQVRELRAKGDAAGLKKTVDSFSGFFDKLTERPGKKLLDRNEILFLANCYATLEQHQKAARLYGMLPLPKADPNKPMDDAARQELEKQTQLYWLMQIYRGRELRKAGDLVEAKKLLDGVLAQPKAPAKILAEKELIHLLEDEKKYAEAINRWNEFIKSPQIQKRLTQDNEVKKIYFEVYYHGTMCWFRYSQSEKVKGTAKERPALLRAADRIVKLESAKNSEGWQLVRPYFLELLRAEPVLNQAYLEMKKAS